jgi:hypothetical protein
VDPAESVELVAYGYRLVGLVVLRRRRFYSEGRPLLYVNDSLHGRQNFGVPYRFRDMLVLEKVAYYFFYIGTLRPGEIDTL